MLQTPVTHPRPLSLPAQSRTEGGYEGREQDGNSAMTSDLAGRRDSHCKAHLQDLNQEERTRLILREGRAGLEVGLGYSCRRALTSSEPGQFWCPLYSSVQSSDGDAHTPKVPVGLRQDQKCKECGGQG